MLESMLLHGDQPVTCIYHRVGYDTRVLSLQPDGTICGGGEREAFWALDAGPLPREFLLYGQDMVLTAALSCNADVWRGHWKEYERMPVELRLHWNIKVASMRDYSQYGEQHHILEFFRGRPDGQFLDIGAADGVTDSNTRALALLGWEGMLVEPVPEEYWRLEDNCREMRGLTLINAAIGDHEGYGKMWIARQQHFNASDHGDNRHTLSDAVAEEARCARQPAEFDCREIRMWDVDRLISARPDSVAFISVDTEGNDACIVKALLLQGERPELLVFEIDKLEDGSLQELLAKCDYSLLFRTRSNEGWYACRGEVIK